MMSLSMSNYILLSEDEKKYILDNADKRSTSEMAEWIGCHISTVRYQLRKNGIKPYQFSKWSQVKKMELLSMRQRGIKTTEIARHFNVTPTSVRCQLALLRKHGYSVPTQKEAAMIRRKENVLSKAEKENAPTITHR